MPDPELVYSAYVGTNADVFPHVVRLHVPRGSTVADVTFGKGVFWRKIPKNEYTVLATDLSQGVDLRALPYLDGTLDALVLDPPYMHSPGGTAHAGHQNYESYYGNNRAPASDYKYHDAVLRLYMEGIDEAQRVVKRAGTLIVKCQSQVCANQMRVTGAELVHFLVGRGWTVTDEIVVVSTNKPGISRMKRQQHSRRKHSTFIVAVNKKATGLAMTLDKRIWPQIRTT